MAEKLDVRPEGRDLPPRRRIEAARDRLGKFPDEQIANELGLSRSFVGNYRREHGIAAYEGYLFGPGRVPLRDLPPETGKALRAAVAERSRPASPRPKKPAPASAPDLQAFVGKLGTVSDEEIAREAGATPQQVSAFRKERGIGRFRAGAYSRKPQREAPAAAPARAPTGPAVVEVAKVTRPKALLAFTVRATANGSQREFVAIGADIAAACVAVQVGLGARTDGPWVVDEVRFLNDALG